LLDKVGGKDTVDVEDMDIWKLVFIVEVPAPFKPEEDPLVREGEGGRFITTVFYTEYTISGIRRGKEMIVVRRSRLFISC
jgi:hypothetical protein